ncbi:MAG: N-6 DNA methylase, partial [Fusobacteriaceae bacterium]
EEFKAKGIFYTPPEMVKLLLKYVDIEFNNVYDPTCGDGELLAHFDDEVPKYGQELNSPQMEVAQERLINFTGITGDTLVEPAFLDMKFDLIMGNPPFSVKWNPIHKEDDRFKEFSTVPTGARADYAFNLHILHMLSDKGKAIVMNAPGVLFRGNREGAIRKELIERNWIERVVRVPKDTFVDTKIETCIIIYNKSKSNTDIIFEDLELKEEKVVTLSEIVENDYNLGISRYIQPPSTEKQYSDNDMIEMNIQVRNMSVENLRCSLNFDYQLLELQPGNQVVWLDQLQELIDEYKNKPLNKLG